METIPTKRQRTKEEIKYPVKLQELLEGILGSKNVYFQPPSGKKMSYPAIVYDLDYINKFYGDNESYLSMKRYTITYIDRMPDMTVPDKIIELPYCTYSRFYTTEDFNHYMFKLYFKEV